MNDVGDYTRARDLLMDIQQRERVVGAESASAQDHREGRLQPERSSEDASIHRAGPSPAVASRRPVRIRGQACAVAGRNPLRGRSEQAARGSARLSVTRQPRAIVTEGSLSDLSLRQLSDLSLRDGYLRRGDGTPFTRHRPPKARV